MKENRTILEVVEFGAKLDWLTLSAPVDREQARGFHRFARNYMLRERERYNVQTEAKLRGYSGVQVADSKHVRRAYDGHEMLIVSGEHSNRLVEEVILDGTQAKITRIDARVLARCREPVFNYPELLRSGIISARTESGKKERKKLTLYDSRVGCDGICVGSRSSERYVRIYDHEAKHGDKAGGVLWAHEGEFKGDSAQKFFEGYRDSTHRAAYCAGVMKRTLQSMDINCPWLEEVAEVALVVGRKITTNEKRLAYQKKIGLPMLQHLVAEGHADEVRELLKAHGLDELFK